MAKPPCAATGCKLISWSRTLCAKHYHQAAERQKEIEATGTATGTVGEAAWRAAIAEISTGQAQAPAPMASSLQAVHNACVDAVRAALGLPADNADLFGELILKVNDLRKEANELRAAQVSLAATRKRAADAEAERDALRAAAAGVLVAPPAEEVATLRTRTEEAEATIRQYKETARGVYRIFTQLSGYLGAPDGSPVEELPDRLSALLRTRLAEVEFAREEASALREERDSLQICVQNLSTSNISLRAVLDSVESANLEETTQIAKLFGIDTSTDYDLVPAVQAKLAWSQKSWKDAFEAEEGRHTETFNMLAVETAEVARLTDVVCQLEATIAALTAQTQAQTEVEPATTAELVESHLATARLRAEIRLVEERASSAERKEEETGARLMELAGPILEAGYVQADGATMRTILEGFANSQTEIFRLRGDLANVRAERNCDRETVAAVRAQQDEKNSRLAKAYAKAEQCGMRIVELEEELAHWKADYGTAVESRLTDLQELRAAKASTLPISFRWECPAIADERGHVTEEVLLWIKVGPWERIIAVTDRCADYSWHAQLMAWNGELDQTVACRDADEGVAIITALLSLRGITVPPYPEKT